MYKKSEKLKALRQAMETGKQEYLAVRDIGITQKQLLVWSKADPRIARYREGLRANCRKKRNYMVEDANFKSALEGNVAAQCFYLKNKAGWKDNNFILNNTVISNSQIAITTMKDDELDNIISSIAIPAR